jgi:hypothetical protein
MLRLVELALFLAPFAVFLVWRLMATEGGPSTGVVVGAVCVLVVLTGVLIWLSHEDVVPSGASYEPARLEDGRVVSGHTAPR